MNAGTYAARYGGGHDGPAQRASGEGGVSKVEGKVRGEMRSLMGKVKKEVTLERSNVEERMKRYAIKETEKKLNEMRRGHVEELEKVLGSTLTTVGGSLVSHDTRQMLQLREALESKRDEMLVQQRDNIYAKLEVAVRSLEREHEHRMKNLKEEAELNARSEMTRRLEVKEKEFKLAMAEEELRESIELKIREISSENENEKSRVFGELAVALETGAKRNLEQLRERLESSVRTKENNLRLHSDKVVGEAMESLATEILDSERQELSEIKVRSEQHRVDSMNRTRSEGTTAIDDAVTREKERIRRRRDLRVHELREELQRRTMRDLKELEEAMRGDLKTAESLMIDSVKSGLAQTLQHAAEEHGERVVVDDRMIEDLTRRLRERQMAVVKELPKFMNSFRLRAVGETGIRSGSAEFSVGRGEMEEVEGEVGAGRTAMALNKLADKFGLLERRNEEAGRVLAKMVGETKSLKKELRQVDGEMYDKLYNKGEFKTGATFLDDSAVVDRKDVIENILDNTFKSMAANGGTEDFVGAGGEGGGRKGACRKCRKLYKVNGELLKEINVYQGGGGGGIEVGAYEDDL
ncbi:hypothetical protein TrRE_jg1758 [Triparma retinervis]|uniref:Uncharacterized protein n=1 Tax=Triparma retinervis TaxID=2557542 RepID=A0A9W7AH32_9STRA|nr:hypothetical protein TrRE_jg1758 [Triparma retinervis]